jgi:hypothetical protein
VKTITPLQQRNRCARGGPEILVHLRDLREERVLDS